MLLMMELTHHVRYSPPDAAGTNRKINRNCGTSVMSVNMFSESVLRETFHTEKKFRTGYKSRRHCREG